MADYTIKYSYSATVYWERAIEVDDFLFLVIFGRHTNSNFIAIPNCGVCVEAGATDEVLVNASALTDVGLSSETATALASAIAEIGMWNGKN